MNRIDPKISAAGLVAALLTAGPAWAQDTAFTYQGELKESGNPANGLHDMDFSLWDASGGGTRIGSVIAFSDVPVADGKFAVQLDFGASAFDNSGRWLEIAVEGFTLTPRNPITRSPYSIQTRGIYVDGDENVGIGTTAPLANLHIDGSGSDDVGFHMEQPGDSLGAIRMGSPFGQVGLSGNANNGNRRDLYFMDDGLGLFTRNTSESPFAGNGLFIDELGHVGIGTIDPSFPLHIEDAQPYMQYDDTGGGSSWLVGVQGPSVGFNIQEAGAGVRFVINEGGQVGIGTTDAGLGQLTIKDTGAGAAIAIDAESDHSVFPTIFALNPDGPSLWAQGNSDASLSSGGVIEVGHPGGQNLAIDDNEIMSRNGGQPSSLYLNAEGGEVNMGAYDIHPAYAYGHVKPDGTLFSGSSNIASVNRQAEGQYAISIDGGTTQLDIIIASGRGSGIRQAGDDFYTVYTLDSDGMYEDHSFQFVVYRP